MTDEPQPVNDIRYGGQVLFHEQDHEGAIQVIDKSGLRALHFSSPATQSLIDPQFPYKLQLEYTAVMSLAMLMVRQPKRVLLIGLGGGALLQHVFHYFPDVQIDVVERRSAVIEVARKYFLLPDDERVRLYCADALQQLDKLVSRYDVIFNDAYSSHGPDISIYADTVYQQLVRLLSRDGVVVNNLWQRRVEENNQLLGRLKGYFSAVAYHRDSQRRNLVLFVANQPLQQMDFYKRCKALELRCQLPLLHYQQGLRGSMLMLRMRLYLLAWFRRLLH